MPCKLYGSVLTSDILPVVVVTDWEFTVGFLFIWVFNYTNIATSERWSPFRVACNCKLSEIKFKLFIHVNRKDETCQGFISNPMFFIWSPCNRGIATNLFIVFVMNQCQCVGYIITNLMELFNRKVLLCCTIKQLCTFDNSSLKEILYRTQGINNFTFKFTSLD